MVDAETIRSAGFWEDRKIFVAGGTAEGFPDGQVPEGSVLFKTSGSTGEAKWVLLGKEALLVSARAVNAWLGVDPGSVWGLALPLNHVGGFGVVARASAAGCVFAEYEGKWDAGRFAKWVESEGVTHTSLVPTQVHDLLAAGMEGAPSLRAVVVGGGRMSDGAGQAARDAGWPVLASYGMTEACSQVATQRMDSLDQPFVDGPLELLSIWDAEVNNEGLLELRGKALFSGTVEDGEYQRREGEWFTTSDRASVCGRNITPLGRADSLVKILGELVDIEGVETRFLEVARGRVAPERFAVVPVKDARRGHCLLAVFEYGTRDAAVCFSEYQGLAPGLERFERFVGVEVFPRTALGKLKRGELAELCGCGGA